MTFAILVSMFWLGFLLWLIHRSDVGLTNFLPFNGGFIFPIPLFYPLLTAVCKVYPRRGEHAVFKDRARVYTGYGKGQHSCFFCEDVEQIKVEDAFYLSGHFFSSRFDSNVGSLAGGACTIWDYGIRE